ncbi:hypothetical protein CPB83DRAFT_850303 [Crepidotus variabilis]|uniref:Ricin B lectin domain-containing protein n=1 Tax=Crepidotus variabilis TaxID=179855 RepID=A0A9P6EKL0_9AGAR|nr:hypothetical protein CPB83DRAFT_850303 [Crepidotus variabilis]
MSLLFDSSSYTDSISSSISETDTEMSTDTSDQEIAPGVYRIINDVNSGYVVDLSGYDLKSVIAYESHDGENQKWEIQRLGPGYSIKCLFNDAFLTLDSGLMDGGKLRAIPYPVSWEILPDAESTEGKIRYRIHWPESQYVLDAPDQGGHTIHLASQRPCKPSTLWRFQVISLHTAATSFSSPTPQLMRMPEPTEFMTKRAEPKPSFATTANTVIDAEDIKIDGDGEMTITTTTTTTVTTNVKVMKT